MNLVMKSSGSRLIGVSVGGEARRRRGKGHRVSSSSHLHLCAAEYELVRKRIKASVKYSNDLRRNAKERGIPNLYSRIFAFLRRFVTGALRPQYEPGDHRSVIGAAVRPNNSLERNQLIGVPDIVEPLGLKRRAPAER